MVSADRVESVAGFGLKGDASYGRRTRQVLLIDIETLTEFGLAPGDVRENITTQDLDFSTLDVNSRLQIGQTLLEATGLCSPCSQLDDLRNGLQEEIASRRGMLARVLEGGIIEVGDPIELQSLSRAPASKVSKAFD